ncbi:hypothetical protein K8R61_02285 [bacterium]|nr:hypothetical protein [bacterium]
MLFVKIVVVSVVMFSVVFKLASMVVDVINYYNPRLVGKSKPWNYISSFFSATFAKRSVPPHTQ